MDSSVLNIFVGGGLATLLLEGIKLLLRKFVYKNPEFDFPSNFYLIIIPVLNILLVPLAALLSVEGAIMPTDWLGWGKGIIVVLVQSLVTVLVYENGIKPVKEYSKEMQDTQG